MGKTFLSWSSGKDSAYALGKLLNRGIRPDLLLTTVNRDYGRVSMHGLRTELLEAQARAAGIPLLQIPLPAEVSMDEYNRTMARTLEKLKAEGFTTGFFGDIFLEDLKAYREAQMAKAGMKAEFPLWGADTRELAMEMIDDEVEAVVVTVSARYLDESYAGRLFDRRFLCDLPSDVDWCGENGEFHTFVFHAPWFDRPVLFEKGEKVYREYAPRDTRKKSGFGPPKPWQTGFWYVDLLPAEAQS
ncbi:MAG: adenine nucleotide alpha hydrolase [Chlorobi bacterium]|nr:adenine nucleotide alpha hydrolase [Chlorobiota bacterium]